MLARRSADARIALRRVTLRLIRSTQMDSPLDDKLAEGQFASFEEQLSNLAREAGVIPSDPLSSMQAFRAPPATIHGLADAHYLALGGALLAASMAVGASWRESSAHADAMQP